MTVSINGTSGIVNDATDLNYTGTLTGGTGVVNLGSGQFYKDASGNVGVGTSSPSARLSVNQTGIAVNIGDISSAPSSNVNTFVGPSTSDLSGVNGDLVLCPRTSTTASILFYTGNGTSAERARIDSSGNLLVGTTSTIVNSNARLHVVGTEGIRGQATGTGGTASIGAFATSTGATYYYIGYDMTAGSIKYQVLFNGNVQNTNNSYGAISDIRLKENIVDATPKLDKLNQVRIVNYNLIGDEQKQIGVIAQELEQVFPSMVEESTDRDSEGNDLGTTTKGVKYSVFVPMLIKAIQEQQTTIVSLQDTLTALTARITALETAA